MSELAHALRFLSVDAIEKARSGHPGAPMGMAEMAEVLWMRFLRHNPGNPSFPDRDRFVLSNGHASMLLYSLLHLTGYDLSLEDLKQFRQWGSRTPGHPEYGHTPGVETTTGPLGQGFANAVGMALAERILAREFNREGFDIVNHHTYAFVGDGCLMEGISHEAASLAGTLGLGKLIVLYDCNGISIDGEVSGWFDEDVIERFEAYGWQVLPKVDGHDTNELTRALVSARDDERPSLICCHTVIGCGAANKAGSHKIHGSPLGEEEIAATRRALHWSHPPFEIPEDIYRAWDARERGAHIEKEWRRLFARYGEQYPEEAAEFERRMAGRLPANFAAGIEAALREVVAKKENIATRKASQKAIAVMARLLPELVGGSADLTPSNLSDWPDCLPVSKGRGGNYVHYGVREFGMTAMINGMTLHGGLRPFGSTFLMFGDYARNALRMAALMGINPITVFTHDSVGLGEDGPTHQPVEQIACLRQIPGMNVWRPCDSVETLLSWVDAVESESTPSCLVLSRQNLPFVERSEAQIRNIRRGAYVLSPASSPRAVIIATGSEVDLALRAQKALAEENIAVAVVSMPCTRVFDLQDEAYKNSVLPPDLPRVAVEAGIGDYWRKYVGLTGETVSIDDFGASAPAEVLFEQYGMTVEHTVRAVKSVLRHGSSAA